MNEINVTPEEVAKVLEQLIKVRDSDNKPTEREVVEMIIRMKKRWNKP